jgi:sporulation protein YlmC with PRC-barrel domain
MRFILLRSWLMASAGVAALSAGPALAQQDSACARRLDQMQQQLQQPDVPQDRRADIQLVIDGARTLAETGDEQGCERVSAELDTLMQTVTGKGAKAAQTTGAQQGQEQPVQANQAEQTGAKQGQQTAAGEAKQPGAQQGEQAAAPQGGQGVEREADVTAKLTIEQPQPQVTVHQQPPKVTVRIPKPIITIRMPPPEVSVEMPDPDVQVEVPEPDIRVSMAEPEVQAEGAKAQAAAGQSERLQANVEYQAQPQQAEIDVQMEEPEVRIEQAEPQIDVGTAPKQGAAQQQEQQQPSAGQQPAAAAGPQPQGEAAEAAQLPASEKQTETAAAGATPEPRGEIATSPLAELPASELLGREVVNEEGETVAEIVDMVKRSDGDEVFALLSVGGFLGIGEKEVVVPIDRLDVGADDQIVLSNATEQELENMPDWEEGDPAYRSLSQ